MNTSGEEREISLSVVVSVYNTARWLRECLDSILAQTAFDLEIICVDDGSTDGSPAILREYREKDSRVKVITQENRGISAARNAGLDAARGEYVWFFDSDDTINPEAADTLCRAAREYKEPELICCTKVRVFEDRDYDGPRNRRKRRKRKKGTAQNPASVQPVTVQAGPEALQSLLEKKKKWNWVWVHLIRRDLLTGKGIRFLEKLYRHEDFEFMLRVFREAASVIILPEIVANHRIREGSSIDALYKKIKPEDVKVMFDSYLEGCRTYTQSTDLQRNAPAFKTWLMGFLSRCQMHYDRMIREKTESRVLFPADVNERELFDLLVRYPVETGKSLLALVESEKKLSSWKYRIYTALPDPIRRLAEKAMRRR